MHNFFGLLRAPEIDANTDLENYQVLEKFQFLLFSFVFIIYHSLHSTLQLKKNKILHAHVEC